MALVVDRTSLGPSESEWADCAPLRSLPPLGPIRARRIVVVSPHPDDEVFGTGGLLQMAHAVGIPVELVAVSDGEAAQPGASPAQANELGAIRADETMLALRRLGWPAPVVTRVGIPDGRIAQNSERLVGALGRLLRAGDLCVAPWWNDGHPDHDACGLAARAVARTVGADLLGYLVWAWHWSDPQVGGIPWEHCRRLDFDRRTAARKRWATRAFVSQTQPHGPGRGADPVLPSAVVRRFWRQFEVFVVADPRDIR